MKKFCSTCGKNRLLKSFNKNSSRKDGLQSKCKFCDRKRAKNYFHQNREVQMVNIVKNKLKRKVRNREFVNQYLADKNCVDCEINDLRVLEFDHQRDKLYNVGSMISNGYSLTKLKIEIEKCVVRCSNCHRIKTATDFNYHGYLAEMD